MQISKSPIISGYVSFRLYVDKFENVPFTQRKIVTSKTTFTPNVMVIHKEYIICVAYLP